MRVDHDRRGEQRSQAVEEFLRISGFHSCPQMSIGNETGKSARTFSVGLKRCGGGPAGAVSGGSGGRVSSLFVRRPAGAGVIRRRRRLLLLRRRRVAGPCRRRCLPAPAGPLAARSPPRRRADNREAPSTAAKASSWTSLRVPRDPEPEVRPRGAARVAHREAQFRHLAGHPARAADHVAVAGLRPDRIRGLVVRVRRRRSSNGRAVHSSTLPPMSCRPSGFATKLPTGAETRKPSS